MGVGLLACRRRVAMGTGIWSMHFIGMLAFTCPSRWDSIPPSPLRRCSSRSSFPPLLCCRQPQDPGLPNLIFGGAVIGIGISAMHYTGMAAMEVSPPIDYSPDLLAASIAIAVAASIIALALTFRLRTHAMRTRSGSGWPAHWSWALESSACTTPAWPRPSSPRARSAQRRGSSISIGWLLQSPPAAYYSSEPRC